MEHSLCLFCPVIPKIYLACLSDVSRNRNYLLKLTRGLLKTHIAALELNYANPSSALTNNSDSGRRLTDKLYIFLESLDNSEQISIGVF